uniref:(northern house mosquito) hypothetical protein n=1 Tax=Culex pipiens TaxID=7175 RepID=A0A8D8F4Y9_CULPI
MSVVWGLGQVCRIVIRVWLNFAWMSIFWTGPAVVGSQGLWLSRRVQQLRFWTNRVHRAGRAAQMHTNSAPNVDDCCCSSADDDLIARTNTRSLADVTHSRV